MTTVPSLPNLDDLFKPEPLLAEPVFAPRPPRKVREAATDTLIKANRQATPPGIAEERTTKRMSISEVNAADMPTLMERYQATRYDDRGPITRFLDLLDLPRNVVASTLFPAIRRRKEAEGDVGAFGVGTVRFSDILDEVGVAPGLIRGVVGFIGDVAMDPLTYLGPAGWGAKVVGTGGKTVEITAHGRRALNKAVRLAARGRPVADEAAAGVIRAFGSDVLAKAGGKTAKQVEGELRDAILGAKTGGLGSRALETLGADIGTQGSRLADSFFSATKDEASEAARAFVGKHGRGNAPGVRLGVKQGDAGSYLAHIPFTSYGLFVPSFTGAAQEAGRIAAIANAGFSAASGPIGDQVSRIGTLASNVATRRDELRALQAEAELAQTPEDAERIQTQIAALREDVAAQTRDAEGIVFGPQGERGLQPGMPGNRLDSIGDVLWQNEQLAKIEADAAEIMNANRDTLETVAKRRQIVSAVSKDPRDPAEAALSLSPSQRALLDMSDTEADVMEAVADSVQREFQIRRAQADAIRGTIQEVAARTDNKVLADIAADLVGLGPTTGGYSAFTPLRSVTRAIFGDDSTVAQFANGKFDAMEEWTRRLFGQSKGEAGRVRRKMEVSRSAAGIAARNAKLNEIIGEVKGALTASGVPEDLWQEAADLTTALAVAQRMKGGENWSTVGSPVLDMLERAKSGPLAQALPTLNDIAAKNVGLLDRMGMDELTMGVLGRQIDEYLPGGATREGAEVLQGLRRDQPVAKGSGGPFGPEAFERPKSMARAVWNDAAGATHDLYQLEHDFYGGFLDAAGNLSETGRQRLLAAKQQNLGIADFNPEFWAKRDWKPGEMEQAAKSLSPFEQNIVRSKLYNELPDAAKIGEAAFKQVDPFLLNQEFPNRLGMMVPGKNIPRGMFETSFAELMAQRTEAHERAMIAAQAKAILDQHATAVTKAAQNLALTKIQSGVDSAELTLSNGAKATIEKGKNGEMVVRLGGKKYRKLRSVGEVGDALNELGAGIYDRASLDVLYPEPIAEAYERLSEAVKSPSQFAGMYDEFLRLWKSVTLMHPSWIVGDVAGGLIQALAAGVNPLKYGKAMKDALRLALASDKPEMLREMRVVIGGTEMSGEQAMKMLNRYSVPSGHAHGEPLAQLLGNGQYLPAYSSKLLSADTLKNPVGAVQARVKDIRTRAAIKAKVGLDASVFGKVKHGEKIRAAKNALVDEGFVRHFASPFMATNARANDALRFATFMAFMDDGHDAAGAAAKALEAHFDVSDLTKFETDFMKRIIPFYSWMKHSGLYWTKKLLQNPALANMAPRVKDAIEESLYGDDTVPDHLRPNWMRDQLALQIGANPETRYALTLGTAIPQETALGVGSALASPLTGAASLRPVLEQVGFGLTLPLKSIIELAQGREVFSGRSIGFEPNQGDLSLGEYAAGQLRPLREFGIGNIRQGPLQKAASAGAGPLASRILVGGRSQPFDDDRIRQNRVRQFKQAEQEVRKRATIAEREGNAQASVDARAALMRLYDEMARTGLEDEVPAWARMQLEQLHAGP